jgi:rare lipoprotein A
MKRCALLLVVVLLSVGCGKQRSARVPVPAPTARAGKTPAPAPRRPGPAPTLDELYGYASWYGDPYHGRRTASGEVYNMHELTAAHKTLNFGARVDVQNLDNGKQVQVRINDRGPFIEGRVIDLSYAAAKEIGLIGPGLALVRLTPLAGTLARYFSVQVGAFRDRDNAERLQARVSRLHAPVEIRQDGGLYRVLVGSEHSESAAEELLKQLRRQRLFGMVVPVIP